MWVLHHQQASLFHLVNGECQSAMCPSGQVHSSATSTACQPYYTRVHKQPLHCPWQSPSLNITYLGHISPPNNSMEVERQGNWRTTLRIRNLFSKEMLYGLLLWQVHVASHPQSRLHTLHLPQIRLCSLSWPGLSQKRRRNGTLHDEFACHLC